MAIFAESEVCAFVKYQQMSSGSAAALKKSKAFEEALTQMSLWRVMYSANISLFIHRTKSQYLMSQRNIWHCTCVKYTCDVFNETFIPSAC